ncbi:hypothetical protein Riv7116_3038 [Rivularia sp. PCC 7116]|uniref:hypothetical protein n=1 Tax=Rivularia sp. PCC 7116 TaxID=373994 RepID=UPI00029EE728|nr:hypothetical protein [Rivularia sp. PCC 7116]AFY55517.1 hypothetical protein Riv7116_3038 [Rivularia sp. PCC 7116]
MIYKIQKKLLFSTSIIGSLLLISLITSCSSSTPSDEIPPVAEVSEFTNQISQIIRRDNREIYLNNVKKSLYKEGGITQSIIESNQRKNHVMTLDELIFLIQSCEYENKQACEFIKSRQNQF